MVNQVEGVVRISVSLEGKGVLDVFDLYPTLRDLHEDIAKKLREAGAPVGEVYKPIPGKLKCFFDEEEANMIVEFHPNPNCTCGSEKVGSKQHSSWCDSYG